MRVIGAAGARRGSGRLLDGALALPLGVSAVTVGFGFLIALDKAPLNLRTSSLLIPIAQGTVAIPFVVRTIVPVLRSIDPRLREAAMKLGASPSRVCGGAVGPVVALYGLHAAGVAFGGGGGVMGAGGRGKSTLLGAVAGLETPTGGRVVRDGVDLRGLPPHRRELGLMFQDHALFPHRDVLGNTSFGLRMRHVPR